MSPTTVSLSEHTVLIEKGTRGLYVNPSSHQWTDHCRRTQQHPPVFNIVSDRRGGRTAWSSTVTIKGNQVVNARFWYDGQYVNNAKEDAAEVALQQLMVRTSCFSFLIFS